ncbi:MAG TPA: PilZ domain-containing protein [Allosphingosinicella sp.]|nr:PilZ domain-containing protein [Allosphingosinicella sp.]
MGDIDPIRRQTEIRARRAAARDSLFLSATIRRAGETAEGINPVRVRNLSSVGMMADHNGTCVPGEQVIVTLRGIGSVSGKVAWVRASRIGVAFDSEIDPKLARKPVKAMTKPAPKPIRPLF